MVNRIPQPVSFPLPASPSATEQLIAFLQTKTWIAFAERNLQSPTGWTAVQGADSAIFLAPANRSVILCVQPSGGPLLVDETKFEILCFHDPLLALDGNLPNSDPGREVLGTYGDVETAFSALADLLKTC